MLVERAIRPFTVHRKNNRIMELLYERYINFYTNFAFKKLFGTEVNKDLLTIARNLLASGMEVDQVAQITGLEPAELEQL